MRKINLIIILTITLSFLSALSACRDSDSAPPELLGNWRVLGYVENGELGNFTQILSGAKFYIRIDKTNITAFLESETLSEEEIKQINIEMTNDMANPQKYNKIGNNAWRKVDSAGESSEIYLLGDYWCELYEDGTLSILIR
jgi:hypothetical protein